MACVYNNNSTFSFNSTVLSKSLEKSSLTPASSMKKLLKTVRKIIFNTKKQSCKVTSSTPLKAVPVVMLGCMTEEEHHNWLNEQLEESFASQQLEL